MRFELRLALKKRIAVLNDKEKIIKSENFSKKNLGDQIFQAYSFTSCDFTESNLCNTKFCGCLFTNCNVSLTKLDNCRFQDVHFIDCKIVGAEFFKCEKTFFSPSFKKCFLHYCNFSDLNMKNISFKESKIYEAHFSNTILNGANFANTDLSGTIFHNCDLYKADFSTASRYNIDPRTNKIKNAKFSLPEAVGLLQGFEIIIV